VIPLLAKLAGLTHLDLSATKIGDATLAALARSQLVALDVSSTRITRFDPLPTSLEELAANRTRLGDDSVPAIARLTRLQALDLNHTRLSALGWAGSPRFPACAGSARKHRRRRLVARRPRGNARARGALVGGHPADRSRPAPPARADPDRSAQPQRHRDRRRRADRNRAGQNLTGLGLASTRITDVTLARVGQLAALRALDVSGTKTTDVGVAALGACSSCASCHWPRPA